MKITPMFAFDNADALTTLVSTGDGTVGLSVVAAGDRVFVKICHADGRDIAHLEFSPQGACAFAGLLKGTSEEVWKLMCERSNAAKGGGA